MMDSETSKHFGVQIQSRCLFSNNKLLPRRRRRKKKKKKKEEEEESLDAQWRRKEEEEEEEERETGLTEDTETSLGKLVTGGIPPGHYTYIFVDEAGPILQF
ncbi:hypothetical protein INR49_009163 [Caranx melampygus]|nr:hypothetical protein INR49_009163 [Caranx melampygus]